MASKYLKNENGIVKAITTNNLGLEKPMLNENYDIDVHNRNMDKIDKAIQEDKSNISSLKIKVDNSQNYKLTTDDGYTIDIKGQDLNTIVKTGKYTGCSLINAPNDYCYYVEVMSRGDGYIYQKITALNDTNITKYERTCRNGVWEDWKPMQSHKLTNGEGLIDVTYNGDFNTLTKTGWYYITSPTNQPTSGGAWYLEVMSRNSGHVYQKAIRNVEGNGELPKYERTMYNNTWTAWRSL